MKTFSESIKESSKEFLKNPVLIALSFSFFVFLFGFSKVGAKIAPSLQTSLSNYLWVALSTLILLIFGGLISTLLIYFSAKSARKKSISVKTALKKYWLKNFLTLLMFLIFFNLINLVLFLFTKFMLLIKSQLSVSLETFRLLTILLSFIMVAGVIIFFSFTAFFIVLNDLSFKNGIKASIKFVRKEYINSLLITVIFFAIISLLHKVSSVYADIANFALVLPFMFFIITRFILDLSEK